jgi:hypothetical protein
MHPSVDKCSSAGPLPGSGFGGRPLLQNPPADLDQGNAQKHHGDADDLVEGKALAQDKDGEDGRINYSGGCQDARLIGAERPQDVIKHRQADGDADDGVQQRDAALFHEIAGRPGRRSPPWRFPPVRIIWLRHYITSGAGTVLPPLPEDMGCCDSARTAFLIISEQ